MYAGLIDGAAATVKPPVATNLSPPSFSVLLPNCPIEKKSVWSGSNSFITPAR